MALCEILDSSATLFWVKPSFFFLAFQIARSLVAAAEYAGVIVRVMVGVIMCFLWCQAVFVSIQAANSFWELLLLTNSNIVIPDVQCGCPNTTPPSGLPTTQYTSRP